MMPVPEPHAGIGTPESIGTPDPEGSAAGPPKPVGAVGSPIPGPRAGVGAGLVDGTWVGGPQGFGRASLFGAEEVSE